MMPTAQLDPLARAPMFEFSAEHDALREVLHGYFASTSALEPHQRWTRLLTEVGVDDILCGSEESGVGTIELAILAEESGAALFGGPLVSTAALGVLSHLDDGWAAVTEHVRAGRRSVSAAVSLTCSGAAEITVTRPAGNYRVEGSVEPVWDFTPDTFVVDGTLDGEPALVLLDADADFTGRNGFGPSRPLGRAQCRAATPVAVAPGPSRPRR